MWHRGCCKMPPECTKSPRIMSKSEGLNVWRNPYFISVAAFGNNHSWKGYFPNPWVATNGNVFSSLNDKGRPWSECACWYSVPPARFVIFLTQFFGSRFPGCAILNILCSRTSIWYLYFDSAAVLASQGNRVMRGPLGLKELCGRTSLCTVVLYADDFDICRTLLNTNVLGVFLSRMYCACSLSH